MRRQIFHRNIRSSDQLELFLVSAISSVLGIRFFLHLTRYPQIGGESFHIAHMLWGGLLMAIAIIIALTYLGPRVGRSIAITGGIGFGVFIDELGKFITRDNDYFFEPTIGLIYCIFIIIYLFIHFTGRKRPLTKREYQLNALYLLQEAVIDDFDEQEKQRVLKLLEYADPASNLTKRLIQATQSLQALPKSSGNIFGRTRLKMHTAYGNLLSKKDTKRLIKWFFGLEALLLSGGILWVLISTLDNSLDPVTGAPSYAFKLAVAEFISSIIAGGFILTGIIRFTHSRLYAYEWFRRGILVNIFLTEIIMFSRIQFEALPSFVFNVALFSVIRYAIKQERALAQKSAQQTSPENLNRVL